MTTERALATLNGAASAAPQRPSFNLGELTGIGQILAESGFWEDSKGKAQAIAKVLAGQELGIGPVAAMTGLYIIKGKVVISANVMAGAVKRSGRYDYRIVRLDNNGCEIHFFEHGQPCGVSTFGESDAATADLKGGNWGKFPRNMMFARALSNGVRWFCPDVFETAVYTPDELGAEVNEAGEAVNPSRVELAREPEPDPVRADDEARKHFWATAQDMEFTTPEGKLSKRRVHQALGVELEDGALVPYAVEYGWDALRKCLEDGITIEAWLRSLDQTAPAADDAPMPESMVLAGMAPHPPYHNDGPKRPR